ncbi:MAG: META domain-containing protein [Prevotellaceae bacterium]|jgi:heat shock protein HslJ|nr:META domain-containing protein [Prevotellaceae bacterium]
MKKIILQTTAILLILAGVVACGKEDGNCPYKIYNEPNEPLSLKGTKWKLAGFVDVQICTMKTAEPIGEQCYLLTFHEDGVISGSTSTNTFFGSYELVNGSNISINLGNMTAINELFDGLRYIDCMNNVISYISFDERLILYYNPTNYLLFNSNMP